MSESAITLDALGAVPARPAGGVEKSNEPTDYELAQRAAAGDTDAFESIYRRHSRRVYSVCLRMTGNQETAEDLTQDVFAHLFRKVGLFRGESAFSTWLHRMAVNQVLMHFRKRSVKMEQSSDIGDMPELVVQGTNDPKRTPVIDRIAIDEAVAQLPVGYRTVFVLHDVDGYEHEEIGRMLGVSAGTSKSQLHKARMKLRTLLNQRAALN